MNRMFEIECTHDEIEDGHRVYGFAVWIPTYDSEGRRDGELEITSCFNSKELADMQAEHLANHLGSHEDYLYESARDREMFDGEVGSYE